MASAMDQDAISRWRLVQRARGPCQACGREPVTRREGSFVVRRCRCGDVERMSSEVLLSRYHLTHLKPHTP